jgi:hypothetical protein
MARFKKFDHIGIVVEDLQKATTELSHFFKFEPEELMDIKDAGIRIAFYPLGSGQMEVIEFQKPWRMWIPWCFSQGQGSACCVSGG